MAKPSTGSKSRLDARKGSSDDYSIKDMRENLGQSNTDWTASGEISRTFFSRVQDEANVAQPTLRGTDPKSKTTFRRGRIWA